MLVRALGPLRSMMPSSGFPRRWLPVLNDFGPQRPSGLRWQLWFLQSPDLRLLWCLAAFLRFVLQPRQWHIDARLVHVADDGAAPALLDQPHAFPDEGD